jgi:hypothetical protein
MSALAVAVFLNHCYVAPNRATYDAAAADEFLSTQFASMEKRTTHRADKTYSGLYFYGAHTYFELLEPGKGFSQSRSGLAFGVEEPGGIDKLGSAEMVTRELGGKQLPWFRSLKDGDAFAQSDLTTWIMEYDPQFLAHWHPKLPPKDHGIKRSQLLDRYVAHTGHPRGLFQDITRIELVMTAQDGQAFAKHCASLGYRVARDDQAYTCTGPGLVLHVTPASPPARLGIAKVTFHLKSPAPKREARRLGSSTLELDGDTAVWRFN